MKLWKIYEITLSRLTTHSGKQGESKMKKAGIKTTLGLAAGLVLSGAGAANAGEGGGAMQIQTERGTSLSQQMRIGKKVLKLAKRHGNCKSWERAAERISGVENANCFQKKGASFGKPKRGDLVNVYIRFKNGQFRGAVQGINGECDYYGTTKYGMPRGCQQVANKL